MLASPYAPEPIASARLQCSSSSNSNTESTNVLYTVSTGFLGLLWILLSERLQLPGDEVEPAFGQQCTFGARMGCDFCGAESGWYVVSRVGTVLAMMDALGE